MSIELEDIIHIDKMLIEIKVGIDPYINTGVFDVRRFGAVGDGTADDTEAFKTAWDAACLFESGVLLVPKGYTFMIQSTIFTGPCKGGLVFQVDILFFLSFVTPLGLLY